MTKLVPADASVAAKRGFIRTTAQAYAATIPSGGITAGVIASTINNPDTVLILSVVGSALLSPLLAGLASYFSILSSGIPADYRPEIPPRVADDDHDDDGRLGTTGYVSGV